jgi:Rad3-related DNA helicase
MLMFAIDKTAGVRAMLTGLVVCGMLGFAAPASAAKLGPYFPVPNGFNLNGVAKDALLAIQEKWLQNGLDNLNKAKKEADAALEKAKADAQDQVPALEQRVKDLDKMIEDTKAEIEIAANTSPSFEVQAERKNKLLANVNQWINELNRLATEQMKIAIMSDGMEAKAAENRNFQLSEQADNLEKIKHDTSIENWATNR